MIKIVIVGNGIAAEIIYGVIKQDHRYQVVAFTADQIFISANKLQGLPVVASERIRQDFPPESHRAILAVGYKNLNRDRENLSLRFKDLGYQIETYIHLTAAVFSENIDEGTLVMPNVVIEPGAKVGRNVVIWSNCTIAHHATVEDNCWIAASTVISGEAIVKKNSFVGINSTIVNRVSIGEFNIIGAASVITKNTNSNEVFLSRNSEKHRFDSQNYQQYFWNS